MTDAVENTQVVESILDIIKNINPWLTLVFSILLIGWAATRARSAYFLMNRIWRLVGGGAIIDPDLEKEWGAIRDMEGFRFITGINFDSKEKFIKTLRWLEGHGKSLKELSFARAWIAGEPWIVKPPRLGLITTFSCTTALVCSLAILPMAYLFGNPDTLLTIKSSSVMFWTNGNTARDFFFENSTPSFSVHEDNCFTQLALLQVPPGDVDTICKTLDPAYQDEIRKSLVEQRIGSAYFGGLALIILFIVFHYLARAREAQRFSTLGRP
jgi:hypothetical protein